MNHLIGAFNKVAQSYTRSNTQQMTCLSILILTRKRLNYIKLPLVICQLPEKYPILSNITQVPRTISFRVRLITVLTANVK